MTILHRRRRACSAAEVFQKTSIIVSLAPIHYILTRVLRMFIVHSVCDSHDAAAQSRNGSTVSRRLGQHAGYYAGGVSDRQNADPPLCRSPAATENTRPDFARLVSLCE